MTDAAVFVPFQGRTLHLGWAEGGEGSGMVREVGGRVDLCRTGG